MSNWEKPEKSYDPAVEAQPERKRGAKRADWMAWTLKGIGALLMLSVARLHLSTPAGKVAGVVGPLCFLAAWMASMWASSRESGPEYISILKPKGDYQTRI